ncbi:MAG: hypothetical protein AAGU19_22335 [Prolixibacteraceae bacterium]
MNNLHAKIVDIPYFNDTMPKLPSDLVIRDAFINSIEKKLEIYDVLFVHGDNGVGKTTLLAYFAKTNSSNTISHFITANDRYTYSSFCIKNNLARQIWFFSTNESPDSDLETDDTFSNLQIGLRRKIRSIDKHVYFIFDGFEEVPKQDLEAIKPIIENLPKQAKYIFTGDRQELGILISKNSKSSDIDIPSFSIIETEFFLKEFSSNKESLQEIHKIAHNGFPARLTQLKRLCIDTGSIEKFLSEDNISSSTDLFELEWKQVKEDDNIFLAFIAFSDEHTDNDRMCEILQIDVISLKNNLAHINFLTFPDNTVNYISATHKLFAQKKLKGYEEKIRSLIIDYYEKNKSNRDSIFNLPNLYQKSKKWNELTKLLSIDAFVKYVEEYQTIGSVKRQLDYGLNASKQIRKEEDYLGDYMRFALHKSSFLELEKYEMWESEVEARIVLDEYGEALVLANSVLLKEDKLKLLAIIAKQRRIQGLDDDVLLLEQIKELYAQIDFAEIKEKGYEIATLLIYCDFEIAIELMEKIVDNSTGSNSVDYALAYLRFYADDANKRSKTKLIDIDLINSRIKDKEVKNLTAAFDFLSDEYGSDKIIESAKKLDNTPRKIFLLRYWISQNKEKDNIADVIEYALNEVIYNSNENVPNAAALAEFALPLPYIKDFDVVKNIIKLFDSQRNTINTPTRDYIRLQLTIAEALHNFCIKATNDRFYEIWYLIEEEVSDLSTKTDCLTLVWKKLLKIDGDNSIQKNIYKTDKIENQIKNNLKKLLEATANHYQMVEFIIKTITPERPYFVLEIIEKLNTQERRDAALRISTIHYIEENEMDIAYFDIVQKFYLKIQTPNFKDDIIISLIDKFVSLKEKAIKFIPKLLIYKNAIQNIYNTIDKCYALIHILKILDLDNPNCTKLMDELYERLINTWEVIDVQWRKIEIGFLITKDLVALSKDKAKDFLEKTTRLKESEPLSSNSVVNTYILSVKLCIRAFAGILQKNRSINKEYGQLTDIIEQVQSYGEKAKLWHLVALTLKARQREDDFNMIMKEKIEPLINNLNSEDKAYRYSVISKIAPSLFYYSQSSFFNIIEDCPEDIKDKAVNNICNYIFTKLPANEPIEDKKQGHKISNSEYIEICRLLPYLTDDFLIYHIIKKISFSLKENNGRLITGEQRNNILLKLDEVIDDKLPNTRKGIIHNGYWIVSKAALLTVESYDNKKSEWNRLIESARLIPNISDKALVLNIIAEMIPAKKMIKTGLLEEAFELIQSVPSSYDKITRYDVMWENWLDIDKGQFCKHLKIAYNELLKNHDGTLNNLKNIIDIANQYDKSLAEDLITLLDQDPARKKLKESLQKRISSKEIVNTASKDLKGLSELTAHQYEKVFDTNLSQLNSGRLASKRIDETYEIIDATSNTPLSIAYKSIAYFIQNAIIRNFEINQSLLSSIFEATYQNAKLIATFSADNINKMKNLLRYTNAPRSDINQVFRHGEREKFLKFIRNWIDKNVNNEVTIIDPYFCERDLDFLKIMAEVKPSCFITILSSKDRNDVENEIELTEKYNNEWRKISVDNPPDNRIIIVWDEKTSKCPFHDRWLLSDNTNNGLILNSINSLGEKRDTQIIEMNKDALANVESTVVNDYIYKRKSRVKCFNLKYIEFKLILL